MTAVWSWLACFPLGLGGLPGALGGPQGVEVTGAGLGVAAGELAFAVVAGGGGQGGGGGVVPGLDLAGGQAGAGLAHEQLVRERGAFLVLAGRPGDWIEHGRA